MRPAKVALLTILSFFGIVLFGAIPQEHKSVNMLLNYANVSSLADPTHQGEVTKLRGQILDLEQQLFYDAKELVKVEAERDDLKQGFWWFVHPQLQLAVAEAQLKVSDQHRLVHNVMEDIQFHFLEIKPFFGLRSKMFAVDLAMSWGRVCSSLIGVLFPPFPLTFSLATILFLGPLSLLGLALMFFELGWLMLPFVACGLILHWASAPLPLLLIQYAPSPTEFALTYVLCVGSAVALLSGMVSLCGPVSCPCAYCSVAHSRHRVDIVNAEIAEREPERVKED